MSKVCGICNKKINLLNGKVKLVNDDIICGKCGRQAGLDLMSIGGIKNAGSMSLEQVKNKATINNESKESFSPTLKIGSKIWFDDDNKLLKTNFSALGIKPNTLIRYQDIKDMKVVEDENVITKSGAGSAIGGAVLFGPAGAIIGGLHSRGKKKKDLVEKLHIVLITKSGAIKTIYLINSKTKKNSFLYKATYDEFLQAGSKFEDIITQNNNPVSPIRDNDITLKQQILDLKELLDLDLINQQEFDLEKSKLLNK